MTAMAGTLSPVTIPLYGGTSILIRLLYTVNTILGELRDDIRN